ncbi:hypothetical protein E2C01_034857 [Portunus trituberculatus]|uniref:Uncharacterized protein n=1 Tax=Portunus trituberculatus TaxID=210409 RepID=A0A5B7F7R1_PORTR|nr:hypothetical protein [Portunus trituberculatus]
MQCFKEISLVTVTTHTQGLQPSPPESPKPPHRRQEVHKLIDSVDKLRTTTQYKAHNTLPRSDVLYGNPDNDPNFLKGHCCDQ